MNAVVREAMRCLGVRPDDAQARTLVEEGLAALADVQPRHVAATLPASEAISLFGSRTLAEHLRGCEEAVLLAATLGAQTDQRIRRAEAVDMLRAAVLHACAAAMIEAYCDAVQASVPGAARARFSPGYGDFPLSGQGVLLQRTQASKRIGLHLTEAGMLVPVKSITAVMGLGPALPGEAEDKCARCGKADCAFRSRRGGEGCAPCTQNGGFAENPGHEEGKRCD